MRVATDLLVLEASRWVGVTEKGGNNRGEIVQMFQSVIGTAQGEAWCMAFQQYCLKWVDRQISLVTAWKPSTLTKSEHCLTVWNTSPKAHRLARPERGALVIWQHGTTSSGHVGLIERVEADGMFISVEGNTGDGTGVVRDGDGVYRRARSPAGSGSMKVVGYLAPWVTS